MATPPIVSVVICTYNRKEWLKDCLSALSKQTLNRHSYEVVIVDDGSSDGTQDLMHDMMREYKNVKYLRQKNSGMAAARNKGLSAAKGTIIAFTDDDCIPSKDWLRLGLAALFETGLDGIEGLTTTDKEKTSPLSLLTYTYHGGGFMTSNCFYKKETIDAVGGFSTAHKMRFREDTDLAWRVMDKGYKLGFDKRPEVFHRVIKMSAWKCMRKQMRLRQPWWNAFLARHHSRRYRESSEMIHGMISTQTMYFYLFYTALALSIFSWAYLSLSAFLLSLIILLQNYLIVVFLHTRMRSGIEVSHLIKYPGEFLRLASVWWIAILSDTFWKIAGNIRFMTLNI